MRMSPAPLVGYSKGVMSAEKSGSSTLVFQGLRESNFPRYIRYSRSLSGIFAP